MTSSRRTIALSSSKNTFAFADSFLHIFNTSKECGLGDKRFFDTKHTNKQFFSLFLFPMLRRQNEELSACSFDM